jgi:hypothetical protein
MEKENALVYLIWMKTNRLVAQVRRINSLKNEELTKKGEERAIVSHITEIGSM